MTTEIVNSGNVEGKQTEDTYLSDSPFCKPSEMKIKKKILPLQEC